MSNLINLLVYYWPCLVNIVGDFNFRINDPVDVNTAQFKALIEQFNSIQRVNLSTHVAGNTLDLVLTCDDVSVTLTIVLNSTFCFLWFTSCVLLYDK